MAIVGIVLLFCGMVTIVWCYSWWRVPSTASALLVVEGSKEFDGANITVDGPAFPSPRRGSVAADNSYICRFPLPAGDYSIRIEHRGVVIYEDALFKIEEYQYALLPLSRLKERLSQKGAATRPATAR
jgi:hypothetical protein